MYLKLLKKTVTLCDDPLKVKNDTDKLDMKANDSSVT